MTSFVSGTETAPTDRHEPILMVIKYGEGRTFHTTLGHDIPALEGVSFITTFLRGTEWAATGKVTQPVPDDFPTVDATTARPFSFSE
jgi:type 1 glutamine amidotransferase